MKRFTTRQAAPRAMAWTLVSASLLAASSCQRDATAPATTTAPASSNPSASPIRIVSVDPAATLQLVQIGAADRLVGVTKYDQLFLPEAQRDLPIVGDYDTLDYERLLALHPTALIIQKSPTQVPDRLRNITQSHHIELLNLRTGKIADIWDSARALGKIADRADAAERAITLAQAQLNEVKDRYAADPARPRVLYIMSPLSLMICGAGTMESDLLEIAGAKNAGADVGPNYPELSKEAVIKLAPDVLLLGAPDEPDQQKDDPRLDTWLALPIPAARHHRIWLVTDGNMQMPSLDIGKNVQTLSELIHANAPGPAPVAAPAASTDKPGEKP